MVIVVMGVCSCGKTTVGKLLAAALGVAFYDADDFHSPSNVEKMKAGVPLEDEDRLPWLTKLVKQMGQWQTAGGAVLACSALKECYRRILRKGTSEIRFVYLRGSKERIIERIRNRKGHYMPPELVDGQFATLEEPTDAIVADITLPPSKIVERVLQAIEGEKTDKYFAEGTPDMVIDRPRTVRLLEHLLEELGKVRRVLLVPPDFTRFHSNAGEILSILYERLCARAYVEVMPAIGTHRPMTEEEISQMFPGVPLSAFRQHDWRGALVRLGRVPADFVADVTGNHLRFGIWCEVNQLLAEGHWDRIISIGQLVPHEVAGIANHNKNIFVGLGGRDTINKTHYIGAVCDMEEIMGHESSPVRDVLNYMSRHFATNLPITYILTVRGKDKSGDLVTRGLYAGDGETCFLQGAKLCRKVNINLLDAPIRKAVVYLNRNEFKSAWLGNKAIYRSRMAMADGGKLVILAPGVCEFSRDAEIDRLIRKYGYRGRDNIVRMVKANVDLAANLSVAAHLIHGSSEERFAITYCTNGLGGGKGLTRKELENVGFQYADIDRMMRDYSPQTMRDGYNTMPNGQDVFYISNPSLGLWALRSKFED